MIDPSSLPLLLVTGFVIAAAMVLLWIASLLLRDASIVDRFWGLGFVLVSLLGLGLGAGPLARRALLAMLVALWGLRLTWHITTRNWDEGEDPRYQAMRRYWGERFWWVSLLTVFALQGVLLWIVSLPLQVAADAQHPPHLTWLDLAGSAVWLIGLLFEAIGDAQLRRFRAEPANRGQVMDRGLWRYTRHPNYFGDAVVWWGLFLISAQTRIALLGVVSPLVMTFLLTRISGVPMLERQLQRTKPGYADYCRRTSAFVPWPPKAS